MPRSSTPAKSPGVLHGAGKWLTAGITTLAALFAVLVNAKNLGLDVWLGSMGLGFADRAAQRVTVIPRVDSLFALGDSIGLAATVTDRRGAVLVGASLRWTTDDSSVVAVDSSGTVVARGAGTTRVNAIVRDLVASARITVRQIPVAVRIPGDSVLRILEGDSVPLVAFAVDSRAFPIRDKAPAWTSSDTAVIRLDTTGVAIAGAPGRAVLAARVGELETRRTVDVVLAPARLELVAGGDQRAPAGRRLSERVTLRVLSPRGTPVPAAALRLALADGEGTLDADSAATDRAGRARVAWTLGRSPGRQYLTAQVDGLDSILTVAAEADPIPANTRIERDTALTGVVGALVDQPVSVRVTDSTGAALADVPVAWTALDGGTVDSSRSRTDSLGQAVTRWILGPKAGRQRLRVQVGNPRTLPPVSITALARSGPPMSLALVSGRGQRASVGQRLGSPVVVAVRDAGGNAVPGVELVARPEHGSVADSTFVSDAEGRAAIQWSLGRATGLHRLEIRAAGVDSPATVTARAVPGAPSNVSFRNPPARATAGSAARLSATVTDGYGNPVGDAMVVFTASAGTLSAARVISDSAGVAATRWTPGPTAGSQTLSATLRGTSIKTTHTVQVAAARRP
jgi:hypothetical protein